MGKPLIDCRVPGGIIGDQFRRVSLYKHQLLQRVADQNPDLAASIRNMKLDWYAIRPVAQIDDEIGEPVTVEPTKVDRDTTEILIYDEIGGSWGVDASELVRDIGEITTEVIRVRINSPGGDAFDSIAIYNALVAHPAEVEVYVDSLAASGASIIAMAGDTITMMVGSQLMIHDAFSFERGNAASFRELADWLDQQSDNIATVYAARTDGDTPRWRGMMKAETWMFASEAVDLGLADAVYQRDSKAPTIVEEDAEEESPETQEEGDEEATEEGDEEATEDDSEEMENRMQRRHSLRSQAFRYRGRDRAPDPDGGIEALLANVPSSNDSDINQFLNEIPNLNNRNY